MTSARAPRVPRAALGAGLLLLAAGLSAALRILPEWRAATSRPARAIEKAREIVSSAGAKLTRVSLGLESRPSPGISFERAYRRLRAKAPAYLEASGGAMAWTVSGNLDVSGAGTGPARFAFFPDGALQALEWNPAGSIFATADANTRAPRQAFFSRIEDVLAAGRPRAEGEFNFSTSNVSVRVRPLESAPGAPAECLVLQERGNVSFSASRQLSDPDAPRLFNAEGITRKIYQFIPALLLFLLVVVLFGILLYRRRLGFTVGISLVLLAAVGRGVAPARHGA